MVRRVLDTKYTSNLTKRHSAAIKEQITGGILSGSSVNDIAKQINRTAGNEIWEAKRLVRTEITGAAAEGELEALRDMEEEFGIKMRYRFYATLDERTCLVCGTLDMQDFSPDDAEEGTNKPPMHPNCRCVIQPVMDDEKKEEIVRRGRDESGKSVIMPKGMTYEKWREEYVRKPSTAPERDIAEELRKSAEATRNAKGTSSDYKPDLPPDNAKKVDELEAKIRERFPNIEIFGLEKADAELVGKSYERMMKVLEDDPEAAKRIVSFEVRELEDKKAFAQTVPVIKSDGTLVVRVQLNVEKYANHAKLVEEYDKLVSEGHFPKGTDAYGLLAHEAGHIRTMNWFVETNGGKVPKNMDVFNKKITEQSNELVKEAAYQIDKKMPSDMLPSKYGSDWGEETIAEAFSDYNANGDDAKPLSKRIVDMLDEGWRPLTKAEKDALFKARMRGL